MYKDIKGFEGLYQISNDGKVFSLINNKVLKNILATNGYYVVSLKDKHFRVHRLVALTYINNPDINIYKLVDHIDGNKLNNHFTNLRWCNPSINIRNKNNKLLINNSVGIRGVRPDKYQWRAEWYDDKGNYNSTSYSINKYGYTEALQMAIKDRWEAEDKFYD